MAGLGNTYNFGEPLPLTVEEQVQRTAIDFETQDILTRMYELAPPARSRHWYSINGLSAVGEKVLYTPEYEPDAWMSAWLETTHWRKGYGPNRQNATNPEIEVSLFTKELLSKVTDDQEQRAYARRRVQAVSGRLTVFLSDIQSLELKAIRFETATTILGNINETLDLIDENNRRLGC